MDEEELIEKMDKASASVTEDKKLHIYEVEGVYRNTATIPISVAGDGRLIMMPAGVHFALSKHSVAWDIGMAWYHYNWQSAYTLIGFMRTVMGESIKTEMLETVRAKHCDIHTAKHGLFMVVWEGQWTLLEKVGFLTAVMTPANLQLYTSDVVKRAKPGGAVLDRV